MYNKPQIEIYNEQPRDCGCNKKIEPQQDCKQSICKQSTCKNKIQLSPCNQEHFAVTNYFSELVHDWEKEAARYNLGISELEGIEYVTETSEEGDQLTKVIFKYRKGHELFTREFRVAPKGDKGDKGDKGNDGRDGEKGDKGDTPVLNKVILNWVDRSQDEGGRFIESCYNNGYDLELNIRKPDTISELQEIINRINAILTESYVKKSDLPDFSQFVKKVDLPNYNLLYNSNILSLLKDGEIISQVTIRTQDSSTYTGNLSVFKKSSSSTTHPSLIGSNYQEQGWSRGLPDIEIEGSEFIWMAQCWIEKNVYGDWSFTRITGLNGVDGVDAEDIEFVYRRFTEPLDNPSSNVPHPWHVDETTGRPVANGWGNHPQGVDEEYPYEYTSFSKKIDGQWSNFSIPILWSHYGKNGHDGDGVEYIFKISENKPSTPTIPQNWETDENYQKPEYIPEGWEDNPQNLTTQGQKQWVSVRKYSSLDSLWHEFSEPTLWNYYAVDGETAEQGLEGAVIRIRGLWKENTHYCGNTTENDGNIRYIDVVVFQAEGDDKLQQYKCLKAHTSSSELTPTNNQYWTQANEVDFEYVKTLIAENAHIDYLDSNEVRIMNKDNEIVAGMTSGNKAKGMEEDPLDGVDTGDIRIWAGNIYNENVIDLERAPFKVYSNGKVVANDVIVSGQLGISDSLFKVNSDIELPKAQSGLLAYLYVDDGNEHEIKCNDSKLHLYTGSEFENANLVTIKDNGIYFIVGFEKETDDVAEQFWGITHTVFKVVNKDTVLETESKTIESRNSQIVKEEGQQYKYELQTTTNIIFTKKVEQGPYLNLEPLRNYEIILRNNDQDQNPIVVTLLDYYKNGEHYEFIKDEQNNSYSLKLWFDFYELTSNITQYEMCLTDGSEKEFIKMSDDKSVKSEMNSIFMTINEAYMYYKQTVTTSNVPTYHVTSNGLIISNEGTVVGEVNENTVTNYTDTIYKIPVNNTIVKVTSKYNGDYAELTNLDSTELEGPNNN